MGCAREDRVDDGLGRPGRIARLRPGRLGSVGAGGLKDPTDTFWPLECILDWHLYYRTEAQMRKLTEMDGVERRELLLEETGNNFILKLWKDGGARSSPGTRAVQTHGEVPGGLPAAFF
jgi:hypothetical protein